MPTGFVPHISSHGNSKDAKPFFPTWKSTLSRIKQCGVTTGPKAVVESLSKDVGGLLGATASGQLPRNEKQVSNIKLRSGLTQVGTDKVEDELFVIMQRAYSEDPLKKFIRDIKTSPEPAVVLADNQQIVDLVRFCTSSFEFGILTADPTFCLGDFDATPITYRHLLLETRRNSQPPIFLGPVLIHYKKNFSSYLFFAASLIGMNRQLEGVRVVGTDGEKALSSAFLHEFGFAQHLTCSIHVRRNIKDKISECNLPPQLSSKILADVFGQQLGSVHQEGLVDCFDNENFERNLETTIKTWRNLESTSTSNIEKFIGWFMENKVEVIRNTMLHSARVDCGLGNPPSMFTTNASESINALLKHKVDYKKHQLPDFIDKVVELVAEQKQEVERAVVNRGKWRLRSQYRFLEIQESVWFTMNAQQRQKHLSRVHSVSLAEAEDSSTIANSSASKGTATLSMDAEAVAKSSNLPVVCVEGILQKASKLLQEENAIVPAPGQSSEARMVLSYSNKTPHMVTPVKGGGFTCDMNCPNWKSIGLCSHSVAVAEVNGKLAQFLAVVKKKKKVPNVTALAVPTMARGRGRKGGVPPRSRKQPTRAEPSTTIAMNVGTQLVTSAESTHNTSVCTPYLHPHTQPFMSGAWNYLYPAYSPPYPPSYPPPCGPYRQSLPPADNPFILALIKGNISVCIGCKNRYDKNLQPPNDLCIKHQEWREFTPTGSETPQSRFSNVYYHCKPQCVWLRCADFDPLCLDTSAIVSDLSPIHKQYLASVFGHTF
jgi:hypothetical protein